METEGDIFSPETERRAPCRASDDELSVASGGFMTIKNYGLLSFLFHSIAKSSQKKFNLEMVSTSDRLCCYLCQFEVPRELAVEAPAAETFLKEVPVRCACGAISTYGPHTLSKNTCLVATWRWS